MASNQSWHHSHAAALDRFAWRTTVTLLAASAAAVLGLAALVLPDLAALGSARPGSGAEATNDGPEPVPLRRVAAGLVDRPSRRAFTVAVAMGFTALTTLLVYQVPVMRAAGLPLATAATLAGVRGLLQTLGRLPVGLLVNRLGSASVFGLAFAAIAGGGVVLAFAGSVGVAVLFAVLAGFGVGAFNPVQGILTEELFEPETLGATMGMYAAVGMVVGAAGPVVAGSVVDLTGDRRAAAGVLTLAAVLALVATLRLSASIRRADGDQTASDRTASPRTEGDRTEGDRAEGDRAER